jgi:HD superfamily phosphohydrolase/serine/threonine protein kinase
MLGEFTPLHRPPVGGEYYVFRDVVHNLIEIEDAVDGMFVRDLLRTPEVQRMRRIRQNGLGSFVYSSLETTRFPHALGSFHIAGRVASSLLDRQPTELDGFPESLRMTKRDCFAFSIAALLHDIGHGPLSHTWEECFRHSHESIGALILASPSTEIGKILRNEEAHRRDSGIGQDVLRFIFGNHPLEYLLPLLEGNLDVDRLDFISRDTRCAGVTYGFHELEWIIRSLRFARLPARHLDGGTPRWIIAIDGRKGLSTLVQFLRARENMYRLVYHHKTTRSATQMLILLFRRARWLIAQGKNLTFSCPALHAALAVSPEEQVPKESILSLDDSDVWVTIKTWAADAAGDEVLRDIARRLLSRNLFKVFLLSKEVYQRLLNIDSEEAGHTIRAVVSARLGRSHEEAEYYYAFDSQSFDVIGRPQNKPWLDVWIMQSGALGFEFQTLREYWRREVGSPESATQYLLLVHPEVVQDLSSLIERLSFPAESAKEMETIPAAPSSYRLIAPLGREGTWKEVWVGVNTKPGSTPEMIVALKRYKAAEGDSQAIDRDVNAINLLGYSHNNLSTPRLVGNVKGEIWIMEPLWTGSLEDQTKKHGPRRDILEIYDIAHQLFAGLAQLHENSLRHTDIKPDNCGVILRNSGERRYVLGDFGCVSSHPDEMPSDWRLLGTLRTRAPEVIRGDSISMKSDVWSMAATIYALCLARYPFMPFDAPHHNAEDRANRETHIKSNLANLVSDHLEQVDQNLPPILAAQLKKCFEPENVRPSSKDVAKVLQKTYSDLSDRNETLFRTAWQRAEDIVSRLGPKGSEFENRVPTESEIADVQRLLRDFAAFIPKTLQSSLENVLRSTKQGPHNA